jgi:hypothetical protein
MLKKQIYKNYFQTEKYILIIISNVLMIFIITLILIFDNSYNLFSQLPNFLLLSLDDIQ